MGSFCSRADTSPPFGNRNISRFYCSCCFPWSTRSIPAYDYDEVDDDDLEFETLLAANQSFPHSSYPSHGRRNSSSHQLWEKIAGLFSGSKRRSSHSPVIGHVKGYQAVATSDIVEDKGFLFGHEADVPVLTEEQIEQITTEAQRVLFLLCS